MLWKSGGFLTIIMELKECTKYEQVKGKKKEWRKQAGDIHNSRDRLVVQTVLLY